MRVDFACDGGPDKEVPRRWTWFVMVAGVRRFLEGVLGL